jgi:hypothetical protein
MILRLQRFHRAAYWDAWQHAGGVPDGKADGWPDKTLQSSTANKVSEGW